MKVAIVGAGPAGSHLACQLSKRGFEVMLFDARPAWEKPCGGGVTSKALREFEFLRDGQSPKQMVSSLRLISAAGRDLTIHVQLATEAVAVRAHALRVVKAEYVGGSHMGLPDARKHHA